MEKGDIFDLGNGDYAEYIEPYSDSQDTVLLYVKEPVKPYKMRKIVVLMDKDFLSGSYRKIGKNEKARLLFIFAGVSEERAVPEQDLGVNRSD